MEDSRAYVRVPSILSRTLLRRTGTRLPCGANTYSRLVSMSSSALKLPSTKLGSPGL